MFIDKVEIHVRSGNGGNGAVHFRREKYVPRGGPDGGDGGRGGDVILEVRSTLNTLYSFRHTTRYIAKDGKPGAKQKMYGRGAEDLIVYVPPGTIIMDHASGEILGDLTKPGQQLTVCKGGRGGRGNVHFKSSTNQAPRAAEKGEPGEEKRLRLELKLIADIGIVGVPNAGKSTLLTALTNATPKIASYPFTTLEPNLGVAAVDEDTNVVLADIPGLIEGASQGIGLGHDFLRHVQRTRVLIHLLDGLSVDPVADFNQINAELSVFDPALGEKLQVVALNKMDQPEVQERWPGIKKQFKKLGVDAIAVSALARTDVHKLLLLAMQKLAQAPVLEEIAPLPVYRQPEDPREFKVMREIDGSWRVIGAGIERASAMTYWEHDGAVRRFQRIMETLGVDEALQKAGAQDGDTVHIGEFELEYVE
ncbi:MAG: GTPase ObgE [Chloroflexi bacterium GWB2_49_20]|nr:MAG: GTPase ObgE [Chloroflexi bacterium GWB2_49_20]OGN76139.1 MAG: GTPase ObgE [Chloroflexi bacterium GWC2_49_37]OGN83525.1 MAG: GTPase ObgE [Chloroflexi bacterium GWD2_49_16]HBG73930.1 GTPase ObgE [Anaerolineae bacterium]HCC79490.1 GTPase ObgE [Anaerolineae bacterium]